MVIACCDAPPVFKPAKRYLDPVATLVPALVVFDRDLALLPNVDAGAYGFVLQRLSEPVGIIAAILRAAI